MTFAPDSQQLIYDFKNQLTFTFKSKLLEELTSIIGLHLCCTCESIYVSRIKHVGETLSDCNISHLRLVSTPLMLSSDISFPQPDEASLSTANHHCYHSIVGSQSYLAICTHPNISFAVCAQSRQLQVPAV